MKKRKGIKLVNGHTSEFAAFLDQSNKSFVDACAKAGVIPTKRQWKKWQRGEGLARKTHSDSV